MRHIFLTIFAVCQLSMQTNAMTRSKRIFNKKTAQLDILYNYATTKDISAICAIYENIERQKEEYKAYLRAKEAGKRPRHKPEPDATKIVIYPKEIRRKIIHQLVRKQRLFVAKHNGLIVGMIKIFLVDNDRERTSILANELRAIILDRGGRIFPYHAIEAGLYTLAYKSAFVFSQEPRFNEDQHAQRRNTSSPALATSPRVSSSRKHFEFNDNQTYIYYGGAYTLESYRGFGINTNLQVYGLKYILKDVVRDILVRDSTKLFYLYGQVDANTYSKNPIRVFVEYSTEVKAILQSEGDVEELSTERMQAIIDQRLLEIVDQAAPINYYGFEAFRPTIIWDRETKSAKVINPDELEEGHPTKEDARGIGKILSANLS